ncbi:uncharacterized protein LOC120430153 isoform X1 [Culex pipiens pallens]|uniref:uncharacterized protein LOC120430153 isoform X1 n=1 Tax=Culex pipiens pallens TaxID=42434 RepID=UPI001954AF85|nr:uncharacterized protein LOC120430153 isoform X1 [Culex pipiens pallens]
MAYGEDLRPNLCSQNFIKNETDDLLKQYIFPGGHEIRTPRRQSQAQLCRFGPSEWQSELPCCVRPPEMSRTWPTYRRTFSSVPRGSSSTDTTRFRPWSWCPASVRASTPGNLGHPLIVLLVALQPERFKSAGTIALWPTSIRQRKSKWMLNFDTEHHEI